MNSKQTFIYFCPHPLLLHKSISFVPATNNTRKFIVYAYVRSVPLRRLVNFLSISAAEIGEKPSSNFPPNKFPAIFFLMTFLVFAKQGGQIWRIFAYWVMGYFWPFFKLPMQQKFLDYFFPR
jgi:hypothetical protein